MNPQNSNSTPPAAAPNQSAPPAQPIPPQDTPPDNPSTYFVSSSESAKVQNQSKPRSKKIVLMCGSLLLLVGLVAVAVLLLGSNSKDNTEPQVSSSSPAAEPTNKPLLSNRRRPRLNRPSLNRPSPNRKLLSTLLIPRMYAPHT